MHKSQYLPIVVISLGFVLLIAAALWPRFCDPRSYWTEEEAATLTESGSEYHALAHQHAHAETKAEKQDIDKEFQQVKTRFDQNTAALERARDRYRRPILIMHWTGVVFLIFGSLAYFLLRSAEGG